MPAGAILNCSSSSVSYTHLTAKEEFTYISDGSSAHVRPHFTFYGFRYVKVTGMTLTRENLDSFAFEACAVYSDLERTGRITTADEKAVSYTHLDVYKRQSQLPSCKNCN